MAPFNWTLSFLLFATLVSVVVCQATVVTISKAPMNVTDRGVFGIDISHYNPITNWTAVTAAKHIKFAFTKATEGKSYVDPTFTKHWKLMHEAGFISGAYHFFRNDHSLADNWANVKANLFDKVNFTKEHLFAVDFESNYNHAHPDVMAKDLYAFLQKAEAHLGFKPWIYTYALFWKENIAGYYGKYPFSEYPLWIAHYGPVTPNIPVDTWKDFGIWQFTSSGHLEGLKGRVDVSWWKNPPQSLFNVRN